MLGKINLLAKFRNIFIHYHLIIVYLIITDTEKDIQNYSGSTVMNERGESSPGAIKMGEQSTVNIYRLCERMHTEKKKNNSEVLRAPCSLFSQSIFCGQREFDHVKNKFPLLEATAGQTNFVHINRGVAAMRKKLVPNNLTL